MATPSTPSRQVRARVLEELAALHARHTEARWPGQAPPQLQATKPWQCQLRAEAEQMGHCIIKSLWVDRCWEKSAILAVDSSTELKQKHSNEKMLKEPINVFNMVSMVSCPFLHFQPFRPKLPPPTTFSFPTPDHHHRRPCHP